MLDPIIQLRRALHRRPELSGSETGTAREIARFFKPLKPDLLLEGLGGNGLAAVFSGKEVGPTVLLRCELDALPIQEDIEIDYQSTKDRVSHKCGHDGHMAILAAVGTELAAHRPVRGRVVLLYQPAEENGEGAAAVVKDPKFSEIKPHFAFASHNLPGFPLGQVVIRAGVFNCASRGMTVSLSGRTAHAAQPETGRSPAATMCHFINQLSALPPEIVAGNETAFATIVGARLGGKAFGTAPGNAKIWVTLRSETDITMSRLVRFAEQVANKSAREHGLMVDINFEDVFDATINSESAVDLVQRSIGTNSVIVPEKPFRWSEDFGRITAVSEGALFGIGAGTDIPDLHNPDYDFPEELIPVTTRLLLRVVDNALASEIAVKPFYCTRFTQSPRILNP
ncbi:MAG: amidohydrolase [Desulfobacteraceae bacterium]|nr:amidohydrolase [Desulfobacteraceae bacterium]